MLQASSSKCYWFIKQKNLIIDNDIRFHYIIIHDCAIFFMKLTGILLQLSMFLLHKKWIKIKCAVLKYVSLLFAVNVSLNSSRTYKIFMNVLKICSTTCSMCLNRLKTIDIRLFSVYSNDILNHYLTNYYKTKMNLISCLLCYLPWIVYTAKKSPMIFLLLCRFFLHNSN